MNTRTRKLAVMVGVLAAMAVASTAFAANNCGNIPPRDGTGRQLGPKAALRVTTMATLSYFWRFGVPVQLGSGYGPGDGTGTGVCPQDGTGYGPGGGEGIGICDGTGPKGAATRRGR